MMQCRYRLKDEPNKFWNDELVGFNFENKKFAELVIKVEGAEEPVHRIIPWENIAFIDIVKKEENNEPILSAEPEPDVVENPERFTD